MIKIAIFSFLIIFFIFGVSESFPFPLEDMAYHFESDLNSPMDSTSNTNMTLASGSQRPTWISNGHQGAGAYNFSGNQYALIEINDQNDLDDSPITTAGWFNADSSGPDDYQTIFYGENSDGSDDYEIYLDPNGNLVFKLDASFTSRIATCTSAVDYRDDTWHHFVAVVPSDNDCKLYVDGVFQDQDFHGGSGTIVLSGNIQIGAYTISPVTDGFHGMIDDIIHWDNYDLNESGQDEVLELFNTNFGITYCGPPPVSEDWIISNSCSLANNEITFGSAVIQNNSTLTIPNELTLTIPFGHNITVISGSGILINNGGVLQFTS